MVTFERCSDPRSVVHASANLISKTTTDHIGTLTKIKDCVDHNARSVDFVENSEVVKTSDQFSSIATHGTSDSGKRFHVFQDAINRRRKLLGQSLRVLPPKDNDFGSASH
jgi:hypothetical protein